MTVFLLLLIIICCVAYIIFQHIQTMRIIQNPMKMLKNISNGKSILLVGNGPSIRSKKRGRQIDSFDIVVRFNSFKIIAPFTGKKTTFHVQSESSVLLYNFADTAIPITVSSEVRTKVFESFVNDTGLIKLPNSMKRFFKNGKYPSTGLIFLISLLQTVRRQVYIVGFDGTLGEQQTFDKSHYYTNDNPIVNTLLHKNGNHISEANIFKTLVKNKMIVQL